MKELLLAFSVLTVGCKPDQSACRKIEQPCYMRDIECRQALVLADADESPCDGIKTACLSSVASRDCEIEGPVGLNVASNTDANHGYRTLQSLRESRRQVQEMQRRLKEMR